MGLIEMRDEVPVLTNEGERALDWSVEGQEMSDRSCLTAPKAPCALSQIRKDFVSLFHHRLETAMRMMLKFSLPVEKGNQAFKDGSLGKTLESIMNKLKPEAAYFAPLDGKRSGMVFFDLADPSQLVEFGEPLFLNLNAEVEIIPVMNADDLRRGLEKASQ
jgi:hypothetical protein